jgi:hypothetical protein
VCIIIDMLQKARLAQSFHKNHEWSDEELDHMSLDDLMSLL